MRIPRSTFYYRSKGKFLEKIEEDMDIEDEIERVCLGFPRYGYRRVTKEFQRRKWRVDHKRVLRIMRENDFLCRMRKKFNVERSFAVGDGRSDECLFQYVDISFSLNPEYKATYQVKDLSDVLKIISKMFRNDEGN